MQKYFYVLFLFVFAFKANAKDLHINLGDSIRTNIDIVNELKRVHPHINTTRYRLSGITFNAVSNNQFTMARLRLGFNHSPTTTLNGSPIDFANNNFSNYHIQAPWSAGYAFLDFNGGKVKIRDMVIHLQRVGPWQPQMGPAEQVGYFEPARSSINSFYANTNPNRAIAQIIFQADSDPDMYVRRVFSVNAHNHQVQLFNGKREIDDDDPAWVMNFPYAHNLYTHRVRVDADTISRFSIKRGKLKVMVRYWND